MDFSLSEEQALLARTLGRYLKEHYGFERREQIARSPAGWSREDWRALAELGVIGALFDAEAGGFGGGGADIDVVFGGIGSALVVEPFLGTLMAGRALAKCGRLDLLARVIEGDIVAAFAHEEAAPAMRAVQTGGTWRLSGAKGVTQQLAAADRIVVPALTDGDPTALFIVARDAQGVAVRDFPLVDGGHGGDLQLESAEAELLANGTTASALIEEVLSAGVVALCCEAVAVMEVIKTDTLNYLRTRKQFGAPIGKFQALQHRMATVALEIEQARSAAINAAAQLDAPRLARERAASAAKYTIGRVGALVAEEALQMHGAIGITWELPLSHYAKRLVMIGHQLGDEDYHLERYIQLGRGA